jgi:hypothetical protein
MFDNTKICMNEQIRMVFHYFVRNFNARQAALEMQEITGLRQEKHVANVFRDCRRQVHKWMQNYYRRTKLGRNGRVIEIDESIFGTIGEDQSKVWVLGFYERGTNEMRAIHVKDRTEQTLTRVILENVQEGAEIITDFWRGYNGVKDFYKHRVVNKAKKGYGTSEYMTTVHVESMWGQLKRITMHYLNCAKPEWVQSFLDEGIWRIKYKKSSERIDFLLQINSYHHYQAEKQTDLQPIHRSFKEPDAYF